MRALVQRVAWAEVEVDGAVLGRVGQGLLVYVGAAPDDTPADADWLAEKVAGLRIFVDAEDRLNLALADVGGGVLVVSNFTLLADARKGRRPSFVAAAPGPVAEPLTERFAATLRGLGLPVATGRFGAHMHVRSQADGPVNVIIDTP